MKEADPMNQNHDHLPREFSNTGPEWKYGEKQLHSFTDIEPAVRSMIKEMRDKGYHYMDLFSVTWAVREALQNAIEHGHRWDASKTVEFTYLVSSEYVIAEVIDEGPGFDPRTITDPWAGRPDHSPMRGLFLMRLFMSWVRFDGRGNRVTLCKVRIPPRPIVRTYRQPPMQQTAS
jgi:anti-sigma regulatory factor (Ser/Thr protein kinase)